MRGRKFLIIGLAVALVTLWASVGQANLLTNGDFGGVPVPSSFITLPGGSTYIPGWTVSGYSIDYVGGYWQAPPGVFTSLDLDGSPPLDNGSGSAEGGIFQSFATNPGTTYQVSFYLAGNPDSGTGIAPEPKQVVVATVGSNTYYFDASTTTHTSMGWELVSFDFTANSGFTTLSFTSETPGYYGPVIGEVSVSQVPLPPTVLLLGSGLLGLFGLGWRWRRKTA